MSTFRHAVDDASRVLHRRTLTVAVALAAIANAWPTHAADLELLGSRTFTCKKGEVVLEDDGQRKRYPPAKYEAVAVRTPTAILRYTCRYLRGIVTCPIDTTVVRVKRTSYSGRFDVDCYGEPRLRADVPGAFDAEAPSDGDADTAGGDAAAPPRPATLP
ncbi:MAG: hypothetical protein RLW61_18395 [Gammaproteobacteria bacterium]